VLREERGRCLLVYAAPPVGMGRHYAHGRADRLTPATCSGTMSQLGLKTGTWRKRTAVRPFCNAKRTPVSTRAAGHIFPPYTETTPAPPNPEPRLARNKRLGSAYGVSGRRRLMTVLQ